MKRALLVGINKYPEKEDVLGACLNDVRDFKKFLKEKLNFKDQEIKTIVNKGATRKGIMKGLEWLVRKSSAGDKLFFLYSGHGYRFPESVKNSESDRVDECIIPVDANWGGDNIIRDNDFNKIFSLVPKGVNLTWVSDSCHSKSLTKAMPSGKYFKLKKLSSPPEIEILIKKVLDKNIKPKAISGSLKRINAVLISACQTDKEASEGEFGKKKRLNGILVHYLLEELNENGGLSVPLNKLIPRIIKKIKDYLQNESAGFTQVPGIEGSSVLKRNGFLK